MKLAWLTDIHLNFLEPKEQRLFLKTVRQTDSDGLLITGDIGEAPSVGAFLEEIAARVRRPVYFVLGNHDFYNGSIANVRTEIDELAHRTESLFYLTASSAIDLGPKTALIGHDGWADGRLGDFMGSGVVLNDYLNIRELRGPRTSRGPAPRPKSELIIILQRLAQEAADQMALSLQDALATHDEVIALTHVPPFAEVCHYRGTKCDANFLPHYSSGLMGDRLKQIMSDNPDKRLTLLCGHTHSSSRAEILPNLTALSGGTAYGSPEVQRIFEVED